MGPGNRGPGNSAVFANSAASANWVAAAAASGNSATPHAPGNWTLAASFNCDTPSIWVSGKTMDSDADAAGGWGKTASLSLSGVTKEYRGMPPVSMLFSAAVHCGSGSVIRDALLYIDTGSVGWFSLLLSACDGSGADNPLLKILAADPWELPLLSPSISDEFSAALKRSPPTVRVRFCARSSVSTAGMLTAA